MTETLQAPPEQYALPPGYRYERGEAVQPTEVSALLRQVEIGEGMDDEYIPRREQVLEERGLVAYDVGVRDDIEQLVGFGTLAHNGHTGYLGDFVVSPAHQRRGIGKAIIVRRLEAAAALGLEEVSTHSLEPTNTLKSFYTELGFQEDEHGDVVCRVGDLRLQ